MARKSMAELLAQVTSTLADNTVGAITPAVMRQMFSDFITAIAPAYGQLTKDTGSTQLLGTTPVKVAWSASATSDVSQVVVSAATGFIERTERGTSSITFNISADGPTGRVVTFTLYKDGAPMPVSWDTSAAMQGAGKPVACSFSAIDYADPAAEYSVWATCDTNSTSTTLSNAALVLSVVPVNSYT